MDSICSPGIEEKTQDAKIESMFTVLDDENCSVEKWKIKPAHTITGNQFLAGR